MGRRKDALAMDEINRFPFDIDDLMEIENYLNNIHKILPRDEQ